MAERQNVVSNLIWRFMERCGSQLVSLVVQIVLARLLAPELFGVVAKVTIVTTILLVFVDSGMANSLIQKKDPDDLDFSSVFFFNLVFCLVLYVLLFFASPWLAVFYKDESLTAIFRVLGLSIIVAGVKNVQQAYVSKTLQFKRFFFATLGGTLFSAVLGITMAYMGYGVWALVAQQLANVTVNTAILWLTVGWRPKLMFSFKRLGGLLSYGWKLLASGLLDTVYNKLREILIAVFYTDADLAYYNRGNSLPFLLVENINSSIDSVLEHVKGDTFRQRLMQCKQEHNELQDEIQMLLDGYHDEGKNPNPMAKGMSWMKTNMKLHMEPSDATIADLMTDGCNMGVKSLNRYLNEYEAADEVSKDIAKRLINLEEKLAVDIRQYL